MSHRPLISICLPTLNAREFLEERIQSIFAQTLQDWELIVCDSHSDDGTWEFLQSFESDRRIRLNRVPREGLYAGWNECLKRARGAAVYMATADDSMSDSCLDRMWKALESNPELWVAVTDFNDVDAQGRIITKEDRWQRAMYAETVETDCIRSGQVDFLINLCLVSTWSNISSILFRTELIRKIGLFPTDFGSMGDLLWTQRAVLQTDSAYVGERLVNYRCHPSQATAQLWASEVLQGALSMNEHVIGESEELFPGSWKRLPDWQDRLLAPLRSRVRAVRGPNRLQLRRYPRKFFVQLRRALRDDRRWLVQHLARGMPTLDEPDPLDLAKQLLQEFGETAQTQPLKT